MMKYAPVGNRRNASIGIEDDVLDFVDEGVTDEIQRG
jgi:hypothetical protein